jgi:cytochrome c
VMGGTADMTNSAQADGAATAGETRERGGVRRRRYAALGAILLLALSAGIAAQAQDQNDEDENNRAALVKHGEEVFDHICHTCHHRRKDMNWTGPSLYGVVGRMAGTEPGYEYSAAMRKFGKVWTDEELNHYLYDPQAYIPGVKMHFIGLKRKWNRHAVIAYLDTLHD